MNILIKIILFFAKYILNIILTILTIYLFYAFYMYYSGRWDITFLEIYLKERIKYGLIILLTAYVFYKSFFERLLLKFYRRESARALDEDINHVNQKSGHIGAGKDTSTIAGAMILKERTLKKERKKIKDMQNYLYMYDFNKLHLYLDQHYQEFLVAGKERFKKAYTKMIRKNNYFLHDYWVKKKHIDPRKHYFQWKMKNGIAVPDIAFEDGLTPGGKNYLDLLKEYVELYIYHNYIPNFIMSNQPVLEVAEIVSKKQIKKLFSKKLSHDHFRIKEDHPMPFPKRGYVIETETQQFYNNADKELEHQIKDTSGTTNLYAAKRHLLGEDLFITGITQNHLRPIAALRELYPSYQHVFKFKFRATSDFTRFFLEILIGLKRFKITRIRFYRWVKKTYTPLKVKELDKPSGNKGKAIFTNGRINKVRKKIAKLRSSQAKKLANGYIEFYIGVYDNIKDVTKKVKFPRLGVLIESDSNKLTYNAFGFKQTVKVKDCFGLFDTHYMSFMREEKDKRHNVHFNDLPNWNSFELHLEDATFMNYKSMLEVLKAAFDEIAKQEKLKKKQEKKFLQLSTNRELPNYHLLALEDLLNLAIDYGIDPKVNDIEEITNMKKPEREEWKHHLLNQFMIEWKKFDRKE